MMMGALDGLMSVASVMLGVGGGTGDLHSMRLAGLAACIAGALSMFLGKSQPALEKLWPLPWHTCRLAN